MRTLAIDLGTRRVGLAISDQGGTLACPYDVLKVTDPAQAIGSIAQVIAKEDVQRLVVGLPLNMDGTFGPAAKEALDWGRQLAAHTGKEVFFVDERLSSFRAEEQLTHRRRAGEKLTHQRKKEQRDALAAAGFLQDFLSGSLSAIDL